MKTIELMLDTSSQTDPDLIIRTAGEQGFQIFYRGSLFKFYFSEIEWRNLMTEFIALVVIKQNKKFWCRIWRVISTNVEVLRMGGDYEVHYFNVFTHCVNGVWNSRWCFERNGFGYGLSWIIFI